MAVLMPIEPFAYWTFDRTNLFLRIQSGKASTFPAWNREINGLLHYWTLDDNDSGLQSPPDEDVEGKFILESNATLSEENFKSWGLRGSPQSSQIVNLMPVSFGICGPKLFLIPMDKATRGFPNISSQIPQAA